MDISGVEDVTDVEGGGGAVPIVVVFFSGGGDGGAVPSVVVCFGGGGGGGAMAVLLQPPLQLVTTMVEVVKVVYTALPELVVRGQVVTVVYVVMLSVPR